MYIYLIHFDERFRHAQHYLGSAEDLDARLKQHAAGTGSRLMEVVSQAGIHWSVARVWVTSDRSLERALKYGNTIDPRTGKRRRRGSLARICPHCQQRKEMK